MTPPSAAQIQPGDTAMTLEAQGIAGRVLGEIEPLAAVRVYLYHLADFHIDKAVTNEAGRFVFQDLPAGLYKVIAHKVGFVPAVVSLTRAAADARQFVEVQLAQDPERATHGEDSFWAIRAEVPADILREILIEESKVAKAEPGVQFSRGSRFVTEMQAMTGVDQIAQVGQGQLTSGGLGIQGQLGDMRIGLEGTYRLLQASQASGSASSLPMGQTSAVSLKVDDGRDTRVTVTSLSNRLETFHRETAMPVDFEHVQVRVSQDVGERARSEFAAQYTNENNFYRHGATDPIGIPEASRSWRLEGSYTTLVGDTTTVKAGLRYRQRELDPSVAESFGPLFSLPGGERVDLFSRGGTQVQPAVLVEYGLYTTLLDGSLSLAPRGGVVVRLGSGWQATTTLSHRLESNSLDELNDFVPEVFQQANDCTSSEESCLRVLFSHTGDNDEQVSFGAVHREYAETLRLYFSDDFFHRLESLYLVPGDRLPEVQFALTRRLAPKILARLESNVAAGGGGIFYATDREAYQNQIRYLVTSLDTQFQGTATGLFIAFHHLQQELNPLSTVQASPAPLELDRLELMLTQDLNVLLNLATDWAIQLNMELSRGSDPLNDFGNDELRKRILGGIAVRF